MTKTAEALSWNADEVRVSIGGQEGQHSRRDA